MTKQIIIAIVAVLAIAGYFVSKVLATRESKAPRGAFQARLEAARAASSGERLVEGVVGELLAAPVTTPYRQQPVAAYAAWTAVGKGVDQLTDTKDLKLENAGFVLKTDEGELTVGGRAVGVSDLVYRLQNRLLQGAENQNEVPIVVGDHVTVLGEVSTRDGVVGFWGNVIIVKGTYEQWHHDVPRNAPVSIPEQP